ncbi:hypothetical protein HKBW3S42_02467, partial [Candidatus Hakubella thermalkaliphila]
IKTPEKPGDYILQLELIRAGVHWLSQVGVERLSREVKVVSASPGGQVGGVEKGGEGRGRKRGGR